MTKNNILLVEDSPSLAALYQSYLTAGDYNIQAVDTGQKALDAIAHKVPHLVLLDIKLPDISGMTILEQIHRDEIPCCVIIMTAHASIDLAVSAMQYGAFDFLVKPFDSKRLNITVKNALQHYELQSEVKAYRETFARNNYEGFIGESLAMQAVYRMIDSAAASNATIFITGESGTGKEVCADAIHKRSQRKKNPFVPLNCGAIPKDLMESEIFGHVKGAFTGAQAERQGAASLADGGTLFLDEICELELDLQTKLLRFIQAGTFQKVGSGKQEKVDIRFVCATNRDPWEEVQAGRFREDLYYRLHVIPIHLPPLRSRETDVQLIMEGLLARYAGEEHKAFKRFAPEATAAMMDYSWPGNVRQLQNIVRNIVVLHDGEEVLCNMIPPPVQCQQAPANVAPAAPKASPEPETYNAAEEVRHEVKPLWLVEKEVIEQTIELCHGNIPKAAALLDVSASTIYRKKEKWD
uniref:sigma-54-dependent transcriptional regulator n=1 Tax=Marinobacterium profundum TaxID=1714300 RepID=UPI0008370C4A|nr:sigma-54 dependent transcriptional regulator [Marinobacterium profundum]